MINKKLAMAKGLMTDNDNSKYDELVKKYKYLLEYYLNSKIDLSNYENLIKNSGLYIGKNDKYKSLNEYLKLDYIFVISRLFIEKLSNEDINLLNSFNNDTVTEELINLIDRTHKDVIYDNFIHGEYKDIVCKVCYGPAVPFNMTDNDSLALKIYYGKNLIELNDDEFIELHEKQIAFFQDLINQIKEDFKNIGIKCEVLVEKDIY